MRPISATVAQAWGAEVHAAGIALLDDVLVVLIADVTFGGVDGDVFEFGMGLTSECHVAMQ